MNGFKNIAIIGTGAVGGYYGALLQRAGHRVHFLLHSDYEQVCRHGLIVESVNGDFRLENVLAYRAAADLPACDLVIIALKTTANAFLPELLPVSLLSEGGVVLSLQNGLGSEEQIAAVIGAKSILGGLCFLCSNKVGPGHIRHLDYGLITVGEYRADGSAAGITPRVEAVTALLDSAGIPVQAIPDLALARWKKLVWNIPFNGLSVVYQCLTDKLITDPTIRQHCIDLMHETVAAAQVCGYFIEPEFIEKMISNTERMKPYAPSMKLDFDRGSPMETDSIYAEPIRRAEAAGFAMPLAKKVLDQLVRSSKSALESD